MPTKTVTLNPGDSKEAAFSYVPAVAKMYQVAIDGLSGTFEAIALIPIAIQVVDLDSNNNEIVDGGDETAFLAAYGSREGDFNYDRQFDANFDGVIDGQDYDIFYKTLGKRLDIIRNRIKTGLYLHLVWPPGWDAYLVALDGDRVQEFTGFGSMEGWTSIRHHPYTHPTYMCIHFMADLRTASYKGLGYGCLLGAGSTRHAYNIFWIGGDWHHLNNWYILEPQNGKVFCAGTPNLASMYHTIQIHFPFERCTNEHPYPCLRVLMLNVDYNSGGGGIINYNSDLRPETSHLADEEPLPEVIDRAYLVGV